MLSSCGVWASHCGGFSCIGAWALGHVDVRWLQRAGYALAAPGLQSTGSVVMHTTLAAPQHVGSPLTRD